MMEMGTRMREPYRFVFCPYDGARLEARTEKGESLPTCPACRFIDYGNPKPGVSVLVEEAGRLLLGRRAVDPGKGRWDMLGGFIELGETAEQAAHREVLEEAGLQITLKRYLGSFLAAYGPRRVPVLDFGFMAAPTGGILRPASDVAEVRWFPAADLPQDLAFAHQPQIIDAWRRGVAATRRWLK
jgi:NADH pyrophosphatase NudC (nudix superfamily)